MRCRQWGGVVLVVTGALFCEFNRIYLLGAASYTYPKGPFSSSLVEWSRSLVQLANGSWETPSHAPFSSHMVCLPESNVHGFAAHLSLGTFWIVQGTNQIPSFGVGTNYSPTGNTLKGAETPEFYATTGLYFVILALVTFVYLICSIRTNVCLFSALFLLVITFALNAGAFFQLALENSEAAAKLIKVCLFTIILRSNNSCQN